MLGQSTDCETLAGHRQPDADSAWAIFFLSLLTTFAYSRPIFHKRQADSTFDTMPDLGSFLEARLPRLVFPARITLFQEVD